MSEAYIYFTKTNCEPKLPCITTVTNETPTHTYSQFRTQHNMGRAITKKTTDPTTLWNKNLQDGIILLIVPSLGFTYVHEMWKSPGLHSTVYQPSQTH